MSRADPRPRALIALTNRDRDENGTPTGAWAAEFAHCYGPLHSLGLTVDLTTPRGGKVPIDPTSARRLFYDAETRAVMDDPAIANALANTAAAADLDPAHYALIYFTGGHGALWDFAEDGPLARLAEGVYANGGIVSAVCHGVAGLLPLRSEDGRPLIAGKRVTGYSTPEEWLAGKRHAVPYLLAPELRERGAQYERSWLPFVSHTVRDERLTTGQNPQSTKALAQLNVDLLRAGVAGRLALATRPGP